VRLLERTPLRVKLIVAVLALVAVALALISLASVTALRGYLVGRMDDQLTLVAPGFQHERPGPGPRGGRPPPSPYLIQRRDAGGKFEVYAWDKSTGERRQVTDRAEGTGYRVSSRLDPRGECLRIVRFA